MDEEIIIEPEEIKKVSKKARLVKFLRNMLIIFIVLLIILLIAGIAYTWYMGENTVPKTVEAVKIVPVVVKEPVQLDSNAKNGASVQMITSPITPGSNASITVKTNRDSKCTITVVYDKVSSTDSGLVTKIADEYGMVSWSWTVGYAVPVGEWPVTVTSVWNGKAAVVVGDLVVTKSI